MGLKSITFAFPNPLDERDQVSLTMRDEVLSDFCIFIQYRNVDENDVQGMANIFMEESVKALDGNISTDFQSVWDWVCKQKVQLDFSGDEGTMTEKQFNEAMP